MGRIDTADTQLSPKAAVRIRFGPFATEGKAGGRLQLLSRDLQALEGLPHRLRDDQTFTGQCATDRRPLFRRHVQRVEFD
jgi:hypothetical protein